MSEVEETAPPQDPVRPEAPGESRRLVFLETLAVFLTIRGFVFVSLLGGDHAQSTSTLDLFSAAVKYCGVILLIGLLLSRSRGFRWNLPGDRGEWLDEVAMGFLICAAGLVLDSAIGSVKWLHESATVATAGSSPAETFYNANFEIVDALLIPIFCLKEEMFYRVYLQTRLTFLLRGKPWLAVLLSASLFAFLHGYKILSTIKVFAVGLLLGTVYQRTRKIPRLVIAHALYNGIVAFLHWKWHHP